MKRLLILFVVIVTALSLLALPIVADEASDTDEPKQTEIITNENNKARFENLEQARIADKRTRDAWIGPPHMRIVDNSTNFKGKIDRLIQEVFATMGVPVPVEIERKFLIKLPTSLFHARDFTFVS